LFTALNDLVKDHCTKQNSKACQNALTNIGILKRFKDIFTKPLRPNQRCHNNHGKGLT
jgi:hypothetical protein